MHTVTVLERGRERERVFFFIKVCLEFPGFVFLVSKVLG